MPIPPLALVLLLGLTCLPCATAQVAPGHIQRPETPNSATAAGEQPGDSSRLILAAANWLAQQSSIRAGVRQQVEIYNQRFVASGTYLQGASETRPVRLELRFRLEGQEGSLQQVYDGHALWTYQQLGDETQLERVDFHRVRSSMAGEAVAGPPLEALATGGLPALLESLAEQFRFGEARTTSLNGRPTLTLEGDWKPDKLAALLHQTRDVVPGAGETIDLDKLPPHLPDQVILTLDQRQLFPHRIEFRRHRPARWFEAILQGPPRVDTLASIEWFDVRFNKVVDPRSFRFEPGDRNVAC